MSKLMPGRDKCQCPACTREIYSRKRQTCEFCGAELPEELRLSAEEIAVMKKEIEEIHARHEADKVEEEKRRADAAAASAAASTAFAIATIH